MSRKVFSKEERSKPTFARAAATAQAQATSTPALLQPATSTHQALQQSAQLITSQNSVTCHTDLDVQEEHYDVIEPDVVTRILNPQIYQQHGSVEENEEPSFTVQEDWTEWPV
jgi:hemoglobin-like flavoprotein